MNQMVNVAVAGSYAALSMADELKRLTSILGRSFLVDGQCENSHRTGLGRPATIPQIEEA